MSPVPMQWRITAPGRIYDSGEDSIVYFDPRSGDTHLLTSFAAFVIEQLTSEPMDIPALTDQAIPLAETERPENVRSAICAVIEELEQLDILERV